MKFYCLRCKDHVQTSDFDYDVRTTKNGHQSYRAKGKCPVCDCKLSQYVSADSVN